MKNLITLILLVFSVVLFAQGSESNTIFNDSIKKSTPKIIENVPLYKGANPKWNNARTKRYMSESITTLINKNFNVDLASTLGLSGRIRIDVMFKINKKGSIEEIKARAPHPALEKEAIRVVSLIPKFDKPGMQRGKPVRVPYSLPIIFEVENTPIRKKIKSKRKDISRLLVPDVYPVFRNCSEDLTALDLKKCTTNKIIDFIHLKFNYELADKLFPSQNSTKFKVEFIVDKKGRVGNITANAYKKEIAIDVINIVKKLPKFKKPGYINGVAVDTPFSILMTVNFTEI